MTTPVNKPYIILTGNGSLTDFAFSFPIIENTDLIVVVDDILQVEYSTYTIEDLTSEGGTVVFALAPVDGAIVQIIRKTTINQSVDYIEAPFMAESHEGALDKVTYILQEQLDGGFAGTDSDGNIIYITFDLDVETGAKTMTITNSGGTDAVLPSWVSGVSAGVFHGEITTAAPEDGEATPKPDGYVWIQVDAE